VVETAEYFLIPLRDVTFTPFAGDVYNMEVEEEHNYLAGMLLASNCQNWVTSQMLRDPDAVAPPKFTTPAQLVDIAIRERAPVVAGFNDNEDELKQMADFLASVDPLMPWHMTAFHPDYKMTDGYRQTTRDDLLRIVDYGQRAGIKYMYPGNIPGGVGEWENTR